MRLLRSLFFISVGMIVGVLLNIMPASAFERVPGIYDVSIEASAFAIPDLVVEAERVAVLRQDGHATPDRTPAAAMLGPIYALSLETDGQSLRRYHMRC